MNALQQYLDRFRIQDMKPAGGRGMFGSVPVYDSMTPAGYQGMQYERANAQRTADLEARRMESEIENNAIIARSFAETPNFYDAGPQLQQQQQAPQPMYQFGQFGGQQMPGRMGGQMSRRRSNQAPQNYGDMQRPQGSPSDQIDSRIPRNALAMMIR